MMSRYPSKFEEQAIKEWDVISKEGTLSLIDFIGEIWEYGTMGFIKKGKRVIKLELHTLGWSGNEDIIQALKQNFIFWSMNWDMSRRGGHYYFTIKLDRFKSSMAVVEKE